ncbi:MAG TPA: DedA family protein [Methylomirabilota bacterium]|nr:DedA family protein [Methylomirabilota bacterium]
MSDLHEFIGHWGYVAIFVVVVLGNVGLPVPEETILALAGYLVWRGRLRLSLVLAVGIVSAVVGDNIGYWLGRRYGQVALPRYARWVLGHPERLETMKAFVARRGPVAVFVARFIPGIRFTAGPLAGALGLPLASFLVANVAGAVVYVPVVVGAGYAVGYGFGAYVERLRYVIGEAERIVLVALLLGVLALIALRIVQAVRQRGAG